MGRKALITKDQILETALRLLIREGYNAVNIKSLATEIGCSTQPIVWHFENMEELRKALTEYAGEYAKGRADKEMEKATFSYGLIGRFYVKMALNEPNLFKFLYLGENPLGSAFKPEEMSAGYDGRRITEEIIRKTGLNEKQVTRCIWNTVIYAHGIATMIATNVLNIAEKSADAMIFYALESFLKMEVKGK